ncbi:competence protein CoiA family protein [Paenisporosarcina macmurdoensis]|uniref:Competence protein CoiA family protein n=1 Tax=Paenisporosarcina macmurdoensis TaxID=212659 RepID=A0ABW1LB74_9BACL
MNFSKNVVTNEREIIETLLQNHTPSELKNLAKKKLYVCPYCDEKLIIRSGDIRGTYFAHTTNNACEKSEQVERAFQKYIKQKQRESFRHPILVGMIKDELLTANSGSKDIIIEEGYLSPGLTKFFPDLYVKIGQSKWAITVITKINESEDIQIASQFKKRKKHFLDNGYQSLWLIDRANFALEKNQNSIVLWETEWLASTRSSEDTKWERLLESLGERNEVLDAFSFSGDSKRKGWQVQSAYYITIDDERTYISVNRYVDDRVLKPFRGFLIGEVYRISLAKALQIQTENFQLADSKFENELREEFAKKHQTLLIIKKRKLEEELRRELERINKLDESAPWPVGKPKENQSGYVLGRLRKREKKVLSIDEAEELERKREEVRRSLFIGSEEEYQKFKRNLENTGRSWG